MFRKSGKVMQANYNYNNYITHTDSAGGFNNMRASLSGSIASSGDLSEVFSVILMKCILKWNASETSDTNYQESFGQKVLLK